MSDLLRKAIRVLQEEGLRSFLVKSGKFAPTKLFGLVASQVRSLVPSVYYPIAECWYRKRNHFDTDHYEAPLNPYKVIWVSPNSITKMTSRVPNLPIEERIDKFGAVRGGDWDISSDMSYSSWRPEKYGDNRWIYDLLIEREFEKTTFFKSAKKHFNAGVPWGKTEFYDNMIDGFNSGKQGLPAYGTSIEEFEQSLKNIDNLYYSVKKRGILPEEKINSKPFDYTVNDSILVDIARDGELLFVEGRRRLTVAKLLDVNIVPVRVQVRHTNWMKYRDQVFKNNLNAYHPDFAEFK